jgi:putative YhbY family RNA-binding protein
MTAELAPRQRRALRAQAHHLEPVVTIGDAGLTPEVIREIEINLKAHELIKIRVLGADRAGRVALISAIRDATGAFPVQSIGRVLVMYRALPAKGEPRSAPPAPGLQRG